MKRFSFRGLRLLALMTFVLLIDAVVAAQGHTVPFGYGPPRQVLPFPR